MPGKWETFAGGLRNDFDSVTAQQLERIIALEDANKPSSPDLATGATNE